MLFVGKTAKHIIIVHEIGQLNIVSCLKSLYSKTSEQSLCKQIKFYEKFERTGHDALTHLDLHSHRILMYGIMIITICSTIL
jgi:hypothetical protein